MLTQHPAAQVAFAPMIKTQLEALGMQVTTTVNDNPDSTDGFAAGAGFDMLLWAQHTLPGQINSLLTA